MNKFSYDSEKVKDIFKKDLELYELEDWKFLAEFHEYHHGIWIENAMTFFKEKLIIDQAYEKLHKHFLVRFGSLPKRGKRNGLLDRTKGRPTKYREHQFIRSLMPPFKDAGFTDEKMLAEFIKLKLLPEKTDIRTLRRIKKGK
jgi:hypothetical protein